VTAVGYLEPTHTAEVGSDQNGRIARVLVAENDTVTDGQVLAELDTEAPDLTVRQAEARVARAEATLAQAEASAAQAERDAGRTARMRAQGASSPSEEEQANTSAETSAAVLAQARAQAQDARVTLAIARHNREEAILRSPLAGTVLTRSVEPGQTVVSALQAATLFEIAADLTEMHLPVEVDEAEVGRIQAGQAATFTVPAWVDRTFEAIQRQVPHLRAVAPQVTASATAIAGDRSWGTSVYGSTRALLEVQGREVAEGRVFSAGEERAGAAACLLGATVKEELFGAGSALDAHVRARTLTCTVIGVLAPKGENTMGMDQDDFVLLPISTVQRRLLGDDDVSMIFVSVDGGEHMDAAVRDLDDLLRQRRHVASDDAVDFQVMDTREFSSFINGIMQVLTLFLAAVASVSLLVGGIGIMNIMLVSVTERTREIGIRLAIGALERDVLTQFLVEAMVLSAFGGTLGLGVGLLGSWIGARLIGIPFTFDPLVAVGAVAFSALVGVVFGFWPARRAARMKPIDALRYE
jgi:putative ABC transport system permease protein